MQKIPFKTDQNNPVIKEYKEAVEKGKRDQHIFHRDNGWVVKQLLSDKAGALFYTQEEAIKHAKTISRTQGTAIFIHGTDGRIIDVKKY